jgi:hypothetical protein
MKTEMCFVTTIPFRLQKKLKNYERTTNTTNDRIYVVMQKTLERTYFEDEF